MSFTVNTMLSIAKSFPESFRFLENETSTDGRKETLGYVCSRVDDFLVSGNEANEEWVAKITSFYNRFKWSVTLGVFELHALRAPDHGAAGFQLCFESLQVHRGH